MQLAKPAARATARATARTTVLPRCRRLAALFAIGALALAPWAVPARGAEKPVEAKLKQLDGTTLKLSELRGRPVLLDLWATWCQPCHQQAAVLSELAAELAERGVGVYAVNSGEKPQLVRDFQERQPNAFPVLLDGNEALRYRLDIGELPALVLLNPDGTVAATALGLSRRDKVLELLDRLASPAG